MGFRRVCLSKYLTSVLLCRQNIKHQCTYGTLKARVCYDEAKSKRTNKVCMQEVLDNYEDMTLIPTVITECEFGKSFRNTTTEHHRYTVEIPEGDKKKNVKPYVTFESVYKEGFNYLNKFVGGMLQVNHSDSMEINQMAAFIPLYRFLKDIERHERCLRRADKDIFIDKPEGYTAVLLTNHLLSNLMSGNEYIISNGYEKEERPFICPCFDTINCEKKMSHRYGQTGIGYEKLWFGQPDILLLNDNEYNSCIMVEEEEEYEDEESYDKDKDVEDVEAWSNQAIAQCITFSLFQARKQITEVCDGTLIPTLVLTPNKFYVYMYDYSNDVLLSSGPSPLWDDNGKHFRKCAVLQIWMVLNHLYFIPQLNNNQVKYLEKSANLHKLLSTNTVIPVTELPGKISFKSSFRTYKKPKVPITDIYPEYALK